MQEKHVQLDTRLWNTDAPAAQSQNMEKSLSLTFWPRPTPRGMGC